VRERSCIRAPSMFILEVNHKEDTGNPAGDQCPAIQAPHNASRDRIL
jgi:hypothetical protein